MMGYNDAFREKASMFCEHLRDGDMVSVVRTYLYIHAYIYINVCTYIYTLIGIFGAHFIGSSIDYLIYIMKM